MEQAHASSSLQEALTRQLRLGRYCAGVVWLLVAIAI